MGKKSSIYFGEVLAEHTTALAEFDSISGRINRTAERYVAICKQHGIDVTEAEAEHIKAALSGTFVEPLLIKYLADEIRDTSSAVVDVGALAKKLEGASFADLVALVEQLGR